MKSDEEVPNIAPAEDQFVLVDIPDDVNQSNQSKSLKDEPEKTDKPQSENGVDKKFGRSKSMQPRMQKKAQLEPITDADTEDSGISDSAAGSVKQTKDEYFGLTVPKASKRSLSSWLQIIKNATFMLLLSDINNHFI